MRNGWGQAGEEREKSQTPLSGLDIYTEEREGILLKSSGLKCPRLRPFRVYLASSHCPGLCWFSKCWALGVEERLP